MLILPGFDVLYMKVELRKKLTISDRDIRDHEVRVRERTYVEAPVISFYGR